MVEDYDAHCLIIEFDDANLSKAEDIAKVRYSRPFVVFIPTETFVESEWADVTIKVKPEELDALDEKFRNVKQLYIEFECNYDRDNAEAKKIYKRLKSELPKSCEIVEAEFRYDKSAVGIEIGLYMSEYERTNEPRWYE